MADFVKLSTIIIMLASLTGCGNTCPEGQVYDLGQVMFVPIYDPALKISRLQPTYPFAACKEISNG